MYLNVSALILVAMSRNIGSLKWGEFSAHLSWANSQHTTPEACMPNGITNGFCTGGCAARCNGRCGIRGWGQLGQTNSQLLRLS